MKYLLWIIIFLLTLQIALAHGFVEEAEQTLTDDYTLTFEVEPKHLVTGKKTHLDIIVADFAGQALQGLQVSAEIHSHELPTEIRLQATQEEPGHYSMTHTFTSADDYELHVEINGEDIAEFELVVDNFGLSGWIRTLVIIGTLLLLSLFAWRDCKSKT